jgi:diguanylate cyclase (GGDEF)-like protein
MQKARSAFNILSIIWRLLIYASAALAVLGDASLHGVLSLQNSLIMIIIIVIGVLTTIIEYALKGSGKFSVLIAIDVLAGLFLYVVYPHTIAGAIFALPILNGFRMNKGAGYWTTLMLSIVYLFGGIILTLSANMHGTFNDPSHVIFTLSVLFLSFFWGNVYSYVVWQQERSDALISLIQVGQELGVTSSLQKVLSMGLNVVKTLFPNHSCVIYLKSTEEKEDALVRVKAYLSKTPECFVDFNMEISPSIIGKSIKDKVPQLVGNFSADPKEDIIPKDKGLRSMMVAPLGYEDKSIGALMVTQTNADFYTDEDLKLFTMLSNQIALAIRNIQIQETMGTMAITDSLSGLFTHGFFQDNLSKDLTKAKYDNKPLSILIIDVDHFKRINDTYGHPQGDALLKQLGGVLKSVTRKEDILCRYGGDEFTVTMINTNRISAVILAEKIRTTVEEYEFVLKGQVVHITISGGVGSFPEDAQIKKELIDCADKALYEAKKGGRNKISFGVTKK